MTGIVDAFWFWYGSPFHVVSGLSCFTKGCSGHCFNTKEGFVPKSVVFPSLSGLFFSCMVTLVTNDVKSLDQDLCCECLPFPTASGAHSLEAARCK